MKLPTKQEAFARGIASGMTQNDAFKKSRDTSRMTTKTIQEAASRCMKNGKILARIAELQKPVLEKVQMTLESHLKDLMTLRNAASKAKQYSAAISAEVSRGKASGFYVERSEVNASVNVEFNRIEIEVVSPK